MGATIRIQREPFDIAAETARLTRGRTDIGAVVTFTGTCRGDENGKPIAALTLEHYPGMAEQEIARHVEEAEARRFVEILALLLQASLLLRHQPGVVADTFVLTRLAGDWGCTPGTLPPGIDAAAIAAMI